MRCSDLHAAARAEGAMEIESDKDDSSIVVEAQNPHATFPKRYVENDDGLGKTSEDLVAELNNDFNEANAVGHTISTPAMRPELQGMPEGPALKEAQSIILENVLGQIASSAVEKLSERTGTSRTLVRKPRGLTTTEYGGPEKLDRELEVTCSLMRQIRKCLDDGSYTEIALYDTRGKEESDDVKIKAVGELLLILRRIFRQILSSFTRPYRPTGNVVKDQETVELLDELIVLRERLVHKYPERTIAGMIDCLDGIGYEADVRLLAEPWM